MYKALIALVLLAIVALLAWKFLGKKESKPTESKSESLAVSKHSEDFNASMSKTMDSYYQLTEAFVNWDTTSINSSIAQLKTDVDSLKLQEMQQDSAIYPTVESQWESIKSEISGMQLDPAIYEKRQSLNMLSQQLFDLLRIVQYDAAKIYYEECPMALDNYESSAFWLSNSGELKERRNPYLGLHDPKYGRGMLTCGNTRDSINFVSK